MSPDRVFGPATTTKSIYDVAAKNVVHAAMEGINGIDICVHIMYMRCLSIPVLFQVFSAHYLSIASFHQFLTSGAVFAYGVTSSGKTHTMHVSTK